MGRSNTVMTTTSTKHKEGIVQFFHELLDLLKSGFRIYTRRRVGHRRSFMMVSVVMLMVCLLYLRDVFILRVLDNIYDSGGDSD